MKMEAKLEAMQNIEARLKQNTASQMAAQAKPLTPEEEEEEEMKNLKKQSDKFQRKLVTDAANAKSKKAIEFEKAERKRLWNPFTGHIHRPNGKREFWDGSGEVGGVNDWV